MANCSLAQVRKRVVSWNCSWTTARPAFFDGWKASGLQGDLLAHVDKLIGQLAEAFVALHPLPDRFELIGGNAFAEILAAEPPLQVVVRTSADDFARLFGLEELFAEMPAANPIDGPHFLEDLLAALLQLGQVCAHASLCICPIHTHQKQREIPQRTFNIRRSALFLTCTLLR